jgi:transcriptional regulator with XRE-family HTH domain
MHSKAAIGRRLLARRQLMNISMKKLADEIGVCEKTISNWERGECVFSADLLAPICRALQWTPSELLGFDVDDCALKLQAVRDICRAIGWITRDLRQVPDFQKARGQMAERDRLRNQLRELLDLPPIAGNFEAELIRMEGWHADAKKGAALERGRKIKRIGDALASLWMPAPIIRFHVKPCAWPPAAGVAPAAVSPA